MQEEAAAVMGEIIFNAFSKYYNALEHLGYLPYSNVEKLLILCFYCDFITHDYRGLLSREDYLLIERALDCLYGTSCLIPYPDYLKMNKLYLGRITELATRIKKMEDTSVLKLIHNTEEVTDPESDITITEEEQQS